METEPVPYGLTLLTPARLILISVAGAITGYLLSVYQRSIRRF